MDADSFAVVIPAYNPTGALVGLVEELRSHGFAAIIVTDDGSCTACLPVFDAVAQTPGAVILHHPVNCGQGRALKTGFRHFLLCYPHLHGVVAFDCDGQHDPQDAVKVAGSLAENPDKLILGIRYFTRGVPWKSRVGNRIARWLFAAVVGKRIADTQCGLRGLSRRNVARCVTLAGDGFDYNMNMLIHADEIMEQPIQTIYVDGNKNTHFKTALDSVRVGAVLLRFLFAK